MIQVAFDENKSAVTIIEFIALLPGNLHFASANAAQQQTNKLQTQITIVVNTLLKTYLENGTHMLAATLNKSEKFLVVGLST